MPFPLLPAPLQAALAQRGYAEPTPVQSAVLAETTAGRDLLVSARTGSGKTVAFGLAMSSDILGPGDGGVRALVVAPTRELALQVASELTWLYKETGFRVISCVGGMDPVREARLLRAGADVVVGTPGRLCDHLNRGALKLDSARVAVLDEGDEMLDMGFREELEFILDRTPKGRRTFLFSATMPKEIEQLASRYQKDALRIATADAGSPHADIVYEMLAVAEREREHAVVNLIRLREPSGALVFCATRDGVNRLHAALVERGFAAAALSGELTQAERGRALTALRDGRARILVATDVAARGLDLPALDLVVHVDVPTDPAVLLHRSGRTGRAGRKGTAVLLVPPQKWRRIERTVKLAKVVPTWVPLPKAEDIRARDQGRLSTEVIEAVGPATDLEPEDLEVAKAVLMERSAEEVVAAFVRSLRSRRPAPEDMPESELLAARLRPEEGAKKKKGAIPRDPAMPTEKSPYQEKAARQERIPARPVVGGDEPIPEGWFRVNVGRQNGADPKWLIPMICQRGNVEKRDIGEIRIKYKETWFEISPEAIQRFTRAATRPDPSRPGLKIAPAR
ncbi:MAG: DEAD/DEAH box helicase [Myxococcales bacterium]|nr:DEAD/DEAH box helicase [Myxococcales bacterium]